MNFISGNKQGTTVNAYINGNLFTKNFEDAQKADDCFRTLLDVMANPDDEDLLFDLKAFFKEKIRISKVAGFEYDPSTDEIYLEGFNTPVPSDLYKTIEEYEENNYPLQSLTNFWKLLMANPDKRIRESLFKFISSHDFVITNNGYMVVYKAVNVKQSTESDLADFVEEMFTKVRKSWKKSPKNFTAYKEFIGDNDFEYQITESKIFETWEGVNARDNSVEFLGNLSDLHDQLDDIKNTETLYTDMYTNKMSIRLGMPVRFLRTECDSDPERDCSHGLHVGATKYVEKFASSNSKILVCLVNPMNVVAVPNYDHTKLRVCEYYPMAEAEYVDRKINIIDHPYFEHDYIAHEEEVLEEMIERLREEEEVREVAIFAESDTRSLDEYQKILEERLVSFEV